MQLLLQSSLLVNLYAFMPIVSNIYAHTSHMNKILFTLYAHYLVNHVNCTNPPKPSYIIFILYNRAWNCFCLFVFLVERSFWIPNLMLFWTRKIEVHEKTFKGRVWDHIQYKLLYKWHEWSETFYLKYLWVEEVNDSRRLGLKRS